jgi:hypothetical protein
MLTVVAGTRSGIPAFSAACRDLGAHQQVHGAAHARHHLAGDHPVGDVAVLVDFQRAQDGVVHMTAPDDGKRGAGVEEAAAGHDGDWLTAGVDQVGIHLGRIGGRRAQAHKAVIRLKQLLDAFGNVVGHLGRHAVAEMA